MPPVRLEPTTPRSRVKHSGTEPPHSICFVLLSFILTLNHTCCSDGVCWVVLDSPVRSTLFTLDRQNSNQVSENSCAEAVPSTPPSEVVWSE